MRILLGFLALISVLAIGACGDDDEGGDGGATEIDVTLQEFSINPSADTAQAGEVTFNVVNTGPDDVHEFVIIKTDLDADALPTRDDGSVDEDGEGIEVIDEIEDMAVGDSQTLTVNLEAGAYVLICNIYDETEDEAHYEEGMRTAFTVE
jgi:uncharacterized cupredoxin-like copper-binding protein